ncbi:MAG TPA: hypothetical protein VMB71_08040, partial [Acetobacteraceae bacterium]|nr:hypothetical protein [Acetobacteraceae bacterium]
MRRAVAKSLTILAAVAMVAWLGKNALATVTPHHTAAQCPRGTLQARDIIADSRRIVTPTGIESLTAIPINGIKQFISVRGRDQRNPILLFLHGGPGSPD